MRFNNQRLSELIAKCSREIEFLADQNCARIERYTEESSNIHDLIVMRALCKRLVHINRFLAAKSINDSVIDDALTDIANEISKQNKEAI